MRVKIFVAISAQLDNFDIDHLKFGVQSAKLKIGVKALDITQLRIKVNGI
ncbi:hypothetical protein N9N97_01915 [Rickettsiaceae bacterium]|nr:hypothetical protein [Rickettsiaceae bacterium]